MPGFFHGTPLERPVTCSRCERPLAECTCPRDAKGDLCPPSQQNARVRREKRAGRFVTVITGLDPDATDLAALAKELRTKLATGGSVTKIKGESAVEVQGDHRDRVVEFLKSLGYPAKPSGG